MGTLLEAVKDAAIKLGTREAMAFLVAKVPFFGWAVVNPIVGLLVGQLLTIIVRHTSLGIYFTYIDLKTAEEAKRFEEASIKHEEAKTNGNPEAIKLAEEEKIRRFRDLIKFQR